MKQLDFNTRRYTPIIKESQTEPVNEVLSALLITGVLGFFATKLSFGLFSDIFEKLEKIKKHKVEIEKSKTEIEKEKQEREKIKTGKNTDNDFDAEKEKAKVAQESEAQLQKSMKAVMSYENAIEQMEDGPEKEKAQAKLAKLKNCISGNATAEEIKELDEDLKRTLSPEEKGLLGKVENSVNEQPDDKTDKWGKENGISADKMVENTEKNEDAAKAMGSTESDEETEPKSEDELRQEIKNQCKDLEGQAIPEQVRDDKDGKFSEEKLNKLSADELKKTANAAGIKTTKSKETKTDTKPDEEWTDDDGTTYSKTGDKYTMTTKDGDTTELTQDEYENHVENDDVKDAERTDNDDELDDEEFGTTKDRQHAVINDKGKDPRKIYKQRTYKRGNKTFKTKSYYSKKGVSITKDEFQEKVRDYEKSQEKKNQENNKKKKNESLGFSFARLIDIGKTPANITESEESTDRVQICKERLVYIKYVMDTTTNSVEKVAMERMYNCIYNFTFDTNGEPRSIEDLYTYLNQTMIENEGKIPGLPTEEQVENIDKKVKAFKELHPEKYKAYMNRLTKENVDKHGKSKGNDNAKDLLSPEQPKDDAEAINKISSMNDLYGFTNILGLEPERKASKYDKEREEDIKKQQDTGMKNADQKPPKDKPEPEKPKSKDTEKEQIDAMIGLNK